MHLTRTLTARATAATIWMMSVLIWVSRFLVESNRWAPRLTRGAGVCSTGSQEEEIVLAAAHQQRLLVVVVALLSQEGETWKCRIPDFSWAEHVARLTEGEFKLRYRVTADSFYKAAGDPSS